jgi:hypothetical protein
MARRRRARAAAFRTPITFPRTLLAFRRAGAMRVKIALSRSDLARLARARDARLSVGLLAVDAARNQATRRLKRHITR